MDSVRHWAGFWQYEYCFIGDELFDYLPQWVRVKTCLQPVVATDLARLLLLQQYLATGYDTVVWCDADFLIFAPERLRLSEAAYALGREVWVQAVDAEAGKARRARFRAYVKVHNAWLLFRQGNTFLDFYAETAQRLLRLNQGSVPPQFIGPKLLTALHNIVQCPVQESAGMLSPAVILNLIQGSGPALDLFCQRSSLRPAGVNLCSSMIGNGALSNRHMDAVIEVLLCRKRL